MGNERGGGMKISLQTMHSLAISLAPRFPYSVEQIFREATKLKSKFETIEDLEPALKRRLEKRMRYGY